MSHAVDWTHLFEEEGPRLLRFLRRFGAHISAEDLRQEAFARLAAAEPGSIPSPRAFLFKVARNLAIDELRRRRASPIEASANLAALDQPSAAPSPEEAVLAADEAQRLQAALAGLSERQRLSLVLFKVEGFTHKEIGARLGVSPRTVERYIADAVKHCHKALSTPASED